MLFDASRCCECLRSWCCQSAVNVWAHIFMDARVFLRFFECFEHIVLSLLRCSEGPPVFWFDAYMLSANVAKCLLGEYLSMLFKCCWCIECFIMLFCNC